MLWDTSINFLSQTQTCFFQRRRSPFVRLPAIDLWISPFAKLHFFLRAAQFNCSFFGNANSQKPVLNNRPAWGQLSHHTRERPQSQSQLFTCTLLQRWNCLRFACKKIEGPSMNHASIEVISVSSSSFQVSRAPKTSTGLAQAVCNSWDLRAAWPPIPFRVECFSEPLLRRLKLVMVVVV